MKYTEKLGLKLPEPSDLAQVDLDMNFNSEILDNIFGNLGGGALSVNNKNPDALGNVTLTASDIKLSDGRTLEVAQTTQEATIASLQSGSSADQLRVAMLEGDFSSWAQRSGQSMTTVFNGDGSITQTARKAGVTVGTLTTSFPADGSIIETLHIVALNKTITKTTSFPADGSISEVVT